MWPVAGARLNSESQQAGAARLDHPAQRGRVLPAAVDELHRGARALAQAQGRGGAVAIVTVDQQGGDAAAGVAEEADGEVAAVDPRQRADRQRRGDLAAGVGDGERAPAGEGTADGAQLAVEALYLEIAPRRPAAVEQAAAVIRI